jgi:hypothetical protein
MTRQRRGLPPRPPARPTLLAAESLDYDRLDRLARAFTPGPWRAEYTDDCGWELSAGEALVSTVNDENLAYFLSLSPPVVTELLDERRQLRAALARIAARLERDEFDAGQRDVARRFAREALGIRIRPHPVRYELRDSWERATLAACDAVDDALATVRTWRSLGARLVPVELWWLRGSSDGLVIGGEPLVSWAAAEGDEQRGSTWYQVRGEPRRLGLDQALSLLAGEAGPAAGSAAELICVSQCASWRLAVGKDLISWARAIERSRSRQRRSDGRRTGSADAGTAKRQRPQRAISDG